MDREKKWTPGGWRASNCLSGGAFLIRGPDFSGQSHLQIVPPEDAYLMAAAPELVEALEAVLEQLEILLPEDGRVHDERAALAKAHAALAKAYGEQR